MLQVVVRKLKEDRSHHGVVLVGEDVAVVDITREFHQCFFLLVEIGVELNSWIIIGLGPPYSKNG